MKNHTNADDIRQSVRVQYGNRAKGITHGCCSSPENSCCSSISGTEEQYSQALGYSQHQLESVPEGANLGLGCGNPQTIASLKAGEVVLDLGSGAGFDCFLAAQAVGATGKVIGVDMTPEMLAKARQNLLCSGLNNIEFRLGEIEHLPVADNHIDVIISNCVINLSPEKEQTYSEAFRVLKPGGRIAISDVLAVKEIPEQYQNDLELLGACISGAETVSNINRILQQIGFQRVEITLNSKSETFIKEFFPKTKLSSYISSASIQAFKPMSV